MVSIIQTKPSTINLAWVIEEDNGFLLLAKKSMPSLSLIMNFVVAIEF